MPSRPSCTAEFSDPGGFESKRRGPVSKPPGMSGLLATHYKANGNHRTRSSDGRRAGPRPKVGNLLIISYRLHRVDSHNEDSVIARSRQRFRL